MRQEESFKIQAASYFQLCHWLSEDFLFFERNHEWKEDSVQTDVFGSFWSVALADLAPGQVIIQSKRGTLDLAGKHLYFVPPFSVIEWHLARGPLKWCGYFSRKKLPPDLPQEPVVFRWHGNYFKREEEIFEEIRQQGQGIPIGKKENASRVASAAKHWMDSHLQEDATLGKFAQSLGVSLPYVSKEFRNCYGISPKTYLNKLRVFEGMILLLMERAKVKEASWLTGFADPSSFYQHFSKEFGAQPSKFQN